MSTIVLAWELGGGHGHMLPLAAVGGALRERGHEVVVVARELHRAESPFGGLGPPILQAPIAAPPRQRGERALTIGHSLGTCGYDCVENFGPIYRAWRVLLESIGPALVVCDFAPTAGLAARGLGLPCVAIGNGYTVPPIVTPTPRLWPWEPAPDRSALLAREGEVLEVINRVLMRCSDRPLRSLAEVFAADERFLLTVPELDAFGPRDDERYFGPLAGGRGIAAPCWPDGDGPRLFVYVGARHWAFGSMVEQLGALGLPTLVYARDVDADEASRLTTNTLWFAREFLDLDATVQQCALHIGHGNHGTTCRVLLGGRPVIVLPEHSEQRITGHIVAALGLGIGLGLDQVRHDYAILVHRILDEPSFAAAAQRLAARYSDLDEARNVAEIATRCEALLR